MSEKWQHLQQHSQYKESLPQQHDQPQIFSMKHKEFMHQISHQDNRQLLTQQQEERQHQELLYQQELQLQQCTRELRLKQQELKILVVRLSRLNSTILLQSHDSIKISLHDLQSISEKLSMHQHAVSNRLFKQIRYYELALEQGSMQQQELQKFLLPESELQQALIQPSLSQQTQQILEKRQNLITQITELQLKQIELHQNKQFLKELKEEGHQTIQKLCQLEEQLGKLHVELYIVEHNNKKMHMQYVRQHGHPIPSNIIPKISSINILEPSSYTVLDPSSNSVLIPSSYNMLDPIQTLR